MTIYIVRLNPTLKGQAKVFDFIVANSPALLQKLQKGSLVLTTSTSTANLKLNNRSKILFIAEEGEPVEGYINNFKSEVKAKNLLNIKFSPLITYPSNLNMSDTQSSYFIETLEYELSNLTYFNTYLKASREILDKLNRNQEIGGKALTVENLIRLCDKEVGLHDIPYLLKSIFKGPKRIASKRYKELDYYLSLPASGKLHYAQKHWALKSGQPKGQRLRYAVKLNEVLSYLTKTTNPQDQPKYVLSSSGLDVEPTGLTVKLNNVPNSVLANNYSFKEYLEDLCLLKPDLDKDKYFEGVLSTFYKNLESKARLRLETFKDLSELKMLTELIEKCEGKGI